MNQSIFFRAIQGLGSGIGMELVATFFLKEVPLSATRAKTEMVEEKASEEMIQI